MGCGCGGSSKVYKKPTARQAAVEAKPERVRGLPAVWNGPKTTVAK